MTHFTHIQHTLKYGIIICLFLFSIGSSGIAQSQMYGDTIFWENFGTGTTRSDIIGLGEIGGMYKYEGSIDYVYALNPQKLEDYKTINPSKTYVTEDVTFHEMPLLTTEAPYLIKPSSTTPTWTSEYYKVTSWRNRTFSSKYTGSTETLPAWDDSGSSENAIPCAWILIDGVWKFGFYYITYSNSSHNVVPDDGHYAITNNLDLFNANWTQPGLKDHTGFTNDTLSPNYYLTGARVSSGDNGRMLFVNCAAVSGISSPIYKRMVTELCRDAWFEFSIWFASVQNAVNNSQFRIEFWSDDPGNDPSLGDLDSSYEGLTVEKANNAKLLKVGETSPLGVAADLGKWFQIKEHFKLTEQDYVWVVVRNYGQGGSGNDIVLDDLVFKPWAPFNLSVELSPSSINSACVDGLVTLLSRFPVDSLMPGYIDITQYAFYFEGEKNGEWIRLGNIIPLQTQSSHIPLELTLPLSEYNLYDRFRITVSSTPSGFGGKCVTFSRIPTDKQGVGVSPQFKISGLDICDDGTSSQTGTFIIKNTNQSSCDGWHIKVRMPDGSLQTFTPATKAICP